MSDNSKIEWTHQPGTIGATWNPTTGCDKISEGCGLPRFEGDATGGCYAMAMAKRLKAMGSAKYQNDGDPRTSGPGFGVAEHPGSLHEPRSWVKPRTVFVNSMSDLFHGDISERFIGSVWDTMAATPQHTYQILTKRPARARTILNRWAAASWTFRRDDMMWCGPIAGPLANVWLGTSIESIDHADRAHHLRSTPAAVRIVSAEPLLGPLPSLDLTDIDWLILGAESGPHARPVDLGWFRELIGMARDKGTAVFVKQLGSVWASETSWGGQLVSRTDKKGGDWRFWPSDLRIREYPDVMAS